MTICQSKHNSQSNLLRGCHDSRVNNPPHLTSNSPACGPVPPAAVCTVLNQNLKNRIVNMGSRLYSAVVHPNDNALLTAAVMLFSAQFRCFDNKGLLSKAKTLTPEESRRASSLVSASRSFSSTVRYEIGQLSFTRFNSSFGKGSFSFHYCRAITGEVFFPPLSTMPTTAIERFIRISALVHHPDSSFGN